MQRLTSRLAAATALLCLIAISSSAVAQSDQLRSEIVVEDLAFPVKMASIGDGDLLVTEKFGTVRLVRDFSLVDQPVAQFDVKAQNEAGLLDVELTPDFEESGEFVVAYTPQEALEHVYVSRLRLDGDTADVVDDPLVELPSIPESDRHFGGTLAFDDDGYLYVSLGDLREPQRARNTDGPAGAILRYNPDGTIPDDNPLGADNPIWAWGLRNPFGISFDDDGNLWNVENSDDVNDELNLIEEGLDYGWPRVEGRCDNFPFHQPCEDRDQYEDPVYEFRTVTGPTGVIRYQDDLIEAYDGDLMATGWHSGAIHHLDWNEDRRRADKKGILYESMLPGAGLTDIVVDDDGALLVLEASESAGSMVRLAPFEDESWEDVDTADTGGCSSGGSAPLTPLWAIALLLAFWARTFRAEETAR